MTSDEFDYLEGKIIVRPQAMIAMEAAFRRTGQPDMAKAIRDRFPDLEYVNPYIPPRAA